MKTKHVKNTGQVVRRGNWKNYQGGKGQTGQIAKGGGAKGAKNCTRWGIAP